MLILCQQNSTPSDVGFEHRVVALISWNVRTTGHAKPKHALPTCLNSRNRVQIPESAGAERCKKHTRHITRSGKRAPTV